MAITVGPDDILAAVREKRKTMRHDRLTAFLYVLLRDKCTLGEIEDVLEGIGSDSHCILPNAKIADCAEWLKKRILDGNSD